MPSEDAKTVKKENVEDDDEKPISQVRNKSKKPSSSPKTATPKQKSKAKKVESNDDSVPLKKPTKPTPKSAKPKKEDDVFVDAKKPVTKDEKKKVKKKKEEEKVKFEVKKRERKVYDLPGQKRDPPEERDPLRIFYETLYQQKPTSELAAIWMMESGLLPLKEATQLYEKKIKSKNQKVTSPVKQPMKTVKETKSVTVKKKTAPPTPNTSNNKKKTATSTVTKQPKKRKAESSEEDSSSEEEDSEDEYFLLAPKAKKARTN